MLLYQEQYERHAVMLQPVRYRLSKHFFTGISLSDPSQACPVLSTVGSHSDIMNLHRQEDSKQQRDVTKYIY